DRLLALADSVTVRGATGLALLITQSATGIAGPDHPDAAARLVHTAATVPGPLARQCAAFGEALIRRDTAALLRIGWTFAEMGYPVHAQDAARAAVTVPGPSTDRRTFRAARELFHDAAAGRPLLGPGQGGGPALTAKEDEVARRAAAGESSRRIAEGLSLSRRTVEGHLYKIYAKLQVSSRRELAEVMAIVQAVPH
ncbi:MAG TPA: helix-turn-helix transcriptional regulator, partial [Micrococcaceae bacterium]